MGQGILQVVVSDTSVIVDLSRGRALEQVFALPYEFVAPDVLYRRELADYEGPQLQQLGLRVEQLDEQEVAEAIGFRRRQRKLSVPDSFALSLAKSREWLLLSGDGDLRQLASQQMVECHGALWVIDQLESHRIITISALRQTLTMIASHPRCRLPQQEVDQRQQHYEKLIQDGHG